MVAMPLIFGRLTAADYEDAVAADPRIDALRARMQCVENPQFTARLPRSRQALHRQRRAGVLQGRHRAVKRGRSSTPSATQAPRRRHAAAGEEVPGLGGCALRPKQAEKVKALFAKGAALDAMPVNELMAALVTNGAPAA